MSWTHPTGRTPKTVALLALGPSRNAYAAANLEPDLSDAVLGVDETWTLNRGLSLVPHDLLWVMDHIQGEADKFPRYGERLWKHDRPIITSDNCDGWPAHVRRFPFNEVWNWLRTVVQPQHGDWYHNSLAYIFVYSAFIGVRELRVFGADYSNHSSGVVEDGHPNVAYWAGRLESVGLSVRMPSDSAFLNANQRHWIYGYRDDPRVIPANRGRFRTLVGLDADEESTALLSGERQVAESIDDIQPDHVARYRWAAERIYSGFINERIYDLGAGIGYGSVILADRNKDALVVSIDRSRESVEYGAQHHHRENIQRNCLDLNAMDASDWRPADCATAFEVIEHLPDPHQLLVTLPARRLFASVPNEAVIPYDSVSCPYHHRHYTRAQFEQLLSMCGWENFRWYGQTGPDSDVIPWDDAAQFRTIIVEADRWHDSSIIRENNGG